MEGLCKRGCKFWKKRQECPNFIISSWREEKTGLEKRIEDCAIPRIYLMLQRVENLLIGLQKVSNQERDANNALAYSLFRGMEFLQRRPGAKLEVRLPGDVTKELEISD